MDRKSEIQELSAADVEHVTGGMILTAFAVKLAQGAAKGGGGGGKDPAQMMFQQIMQQLTNG